MKSTTSNEPEKENTGRKLNAFETIPEANKPSTFHRTSFNSKEKGNFAGNSGDISTLLHNKGYLSFTTYKG